MKYTNMESHKYTYTGAFIKCPLHLNLLTHFTYYSLLNSCVIPPSTSSDKADTELTQNPSIQT